MLHLVTLRLYYNRENILERANWLQVKCSFFQYNYCLCPYVPRPYNSHIYSRCSELEPPFGLIDWDPNGDVTLCLWACTALWNRPFLVYDWSVTIHNMVSSTNHAYNTPRTWYFRILLAHIPLAYMAFPYTTCAYTTYRIKYSLELLTHILLTAYNISAYYSYLPLI